MFISVLLSNCVFYIIYIFDLSVYIFLEFYFRMFKFVLGYMNVHKLYM